MRQLQLFKPSPKERRREVFCDVCHGNRLLCLKNVCPLLRRARQLFELERLLDKTEFFGPSPPAIFVGSWNYPKVIAGPLVPPVPDLDSDIMDAPEQWLDKTFDEILGFRFSLIRGKAPLHVKSAREPKGLLEVLQEAAMSERPTDTELWLKKKPTLRVSLSSRDAPTAPSGPIDKVRLAENPSIPRPVDRAVSDTDLKASPAVWSLFRDGVSQRQITRIFSSGLLGVKKERRLVPTEWSITAIDDMLGRTLHKEILQCPQISGYMLFGFQALANNVQILLMPSAWMYEALEAWAFSPNPFPDSDYELTGGRRAYPQNILGAYHAARLPILEYLSRIRRQAGAIAFLEVRKGWIPLGVWRFREICREALKRKATRHSSLRDALDELGRRLEVPLGNWVKRSKLLEHHRTQVSLESFLGMQKASRNHGFR